MNDQTEPVDINSLRESLELNFKYFIENTLNIFPNKTEEETIELFSKFVEPYPLMYIFVFINAACTKYGYAEFRDVGETMTQILQKLFKLSEMETLALVDSAMNQAIEGTKELTSEKRTYRSIIFSYAEHAGRSFVPGESHVDYLNIYALTIMSSFSKKL